MRKRFFICLSIGLFLSVFTSTAGAAHFTQSITHSIVSTGQNIDFTFTGFQGHPVSDMTVEFWVFGDLNSYSEYVSITVDENDHDFGNWLNSNIGDDTIEDAYNDIGNQCGSELYGSSTIPVSQLVSLIGDGTLTFHYPHLLISELQR